MNNIYLQIVTKDASLNKQIMTRSKRQNKL